MINHPFLFNNNCLILIKWVSNTSGAIKVGSQINGKYNKPILGISKACCWIIVGKEKSKHHILAHFPYPNDGEIGICITHFKLWEFLANQPEDFSIILEDDAELHKDFLIDLPSLLSKITINDFIFY